MGKTLPLQVTAVLLFVLCAGSGCYTSSPVKDITNSARSDLRSGESDYFPSSSFEINDRFSVSSFDGSSVFLSSFNDGGFFRFDLESHTLERLGDSTAGKQVVGSERYLVFLVDSEENNSREIFYTPAREPESLTPLLTEEEAGLLLQLARLEGSYLLAGGKPPGGVEPGNSVVFVIDLDSQSELLRISKTSVTNCSIGNGFVTCARLINLEDNAAVVDIQAFEISSGALADEIREVRVSCSALPLLAKPYYCNRWFFWAVSEGSQQKVYLRTPEGKIMEADTAAEIDPVGFAGNFFFYITRSGPAQGSELKVFNTRVGTRFTLEKPSPHLSAAVDDSPSNPRLITANPSEDEKKTVLTVYEIR